MKTVFVMFDSLVRSRLSSFGGAVETKNIDRFIKKGVSFANHYTGSLPCMPTRKDHHTGRLNFLHSGWGPLEPYDNSFISQIREETGTYTHLITDHPHYWEIGGSGYMQKFSSWEMVRGQEYDPWVPVVNPDEKSLQIHYGEEHYQLGAEQKAKTSAGKTNDRSRVRHLLNRTAMKKEQDYPLARIFGFAQNFLDTNRDEENWFLQIECFDPHEPFAIPEAYLKRHEDSLKKLKSNGDVLNWPYYEKVAGDLENWEEILAYQAALTEMCDHYFGKLLDYFDTHDLWADTALVLTTDHGYLLGKHGWWAKNRMPMFQEISHIPLVIYHPGNKKDGRKCKALTQAIDLAPTFLDWYGCGVPSEVTGQSLSPLVLDDKDSHHECIISGVFGGSLLITDGRYSCYKYPIANHLDGVYEYRWHPTHLATHLPLETLRESTMYPPFDFTKGLPVPRFPAYNHYRIEDGEGTLLFDLEKDGAEEHCIDSSENISRLTAMAGDIMKNHDAPKELYERYRIK